MGILNKEEVEVLLHGQLIGRIGCHAEGKTYVVPVSYAYDGRYIYCHSREGRKISMMRRNSEVCFEVEEMSNMANWRCVIINGKYEELAGEEAKKALRILSPRIMPSLNDIIARRADPVTALQGENHENNFAITFRIRVEEKSGRFEKE